MTDSGQVLELTADERSALALTGATCPFIGSVIARQLLAGRTLAIASAAHQAFAAAAR